MNKYQETYLKNNPFIAKLYSRDFTIPYTPALIEGDKITIVENEDITIQQYILVIYNSFSEKGGIAYYSYDGDNWQKITKRTMKEHDKDVELTIMDVDFANRVKYIKIEDSVGLIEPIILEVEYKEADKEAYYAKKEEERKATLLASANIADATCKTMITITFNPCCSDYASTAIVLYSAKGNIMKKFNVDKDCYYLSITDLAYDTYYYELIQYDKDGNEILKTQKLAFSTPGGHDGRGLKQYHNKLPVNTPSNNVVMPRKGYRGK